MNSIWVDVPNYPNYKVSPEGNILSLNYNKTKMSRELSKGKGIGYISIQLRNKNGIKQVRAHAIVASIFCVKKNYHTQVNHKDGNKKNNHYKNLEWCTSSENIKHSYKNKLRKTNSIKIKGADNGRAKLTECQVLEILNANIIKFGAKAELARKYKVSKVSISNIINRKSWKHLTGEIN